MTEHLDSTIDPKVLQQRLELLADALGRVLIAAGVVHEVPMSGPELLTAAHHYIRSQKSELSRFNAGVVALNHPERLDVGEAVRREDGRFYIPLSRPNEIENLSKIVLRVASDAFPDLDCAEVFAKVIASAYNGLPGAARA